MREWLWPQSGFANLLILNGCLISLEKRTQSLKCLFQVQLSLYKDSSVCFGYVCAQAPGFLESVATKGNHLKSQLQKRLGKNPHVKEVRGQGLLVGIQLDVPGSPLVATALKAGLLILTAGKGDVIRLAPPLVITIEELDKAVDILESCMASLD